MMGPANVDICRRAGKVSPFLMVMGRDKILVNPLSLITDTWTRVDPLPHPAGKTVIEYLTDFQTKLKEIHDLADQHITH